MAGLEQFATAAAYGTIYAMDESRASKSSRAVVVVVVLLCEYEAVFGGLHIITRTCLLYIRGWAIHIRE